MSSRKVIQAGSLVWVAIAHAITPRQRWHREYKAAQARRARSNDEPPDALPHEKYGAATRTAKATTRPGGPGGRIGE